MPDANGIRPLLPDHRRGTSRSGPRRRGQPVRTFLRENGLSLFFATIFLVTLLAQSFAANSFNAEQAEHGGSLVSWWEYVTSVAFWGAVMENWQSEFLQFTVFIGATIWLVQKGSNESKRLEDAGRETNEKQRVGRHASNQSPGWAKGGGWRRWLYENSLLTTMSAIFFATWFAQSLNYWRVFNDEQREHSKPPCPGGVPPSNRTSGRRRCRTGSRSSSP